MLTGTYIGHDERLKGKRAILQQERGWLNAQFDFCPPEMNEKNDGGPLNYLCFGWHPFPVSDFEIDP